MGRARRPKQVGEAKRPKRGQGEGYIHQTPNGNWTAQVMLGMLKPDYHPVTGKLRQRKNIRSVTRRTRQEVMEEVGRLRAAHKAGVLPDASHLTMADLFERWLRDHVATRRTKGTLAAHENAVRVHLGPRIGPVLLRKITPLRLVQAINEVQEAGYAPATVARIYAALSGALTWGVRMRLLERNPLLGVEGPPRGEPAGRVLTRPEIDTLLACAKVRHLGRWWPMVLVALTTGLRAGELRALNWGDVFLDDLPPGAQPYLLVRGVAEGARKSANAVRAVALAALTAQALRNARHAIEAEADLLVEAGGEWEQTGPLAAWPVFALLGGRRPGKTQQQRLFRDIAAAAGISGHVTLKDLRHTFNQSASIGGWDARIRADFLGHTIAVNQRTYTHLDASAGARMAEDVVSRWGLDAQPPSPSPSPVAPPSAP